MALDPQLKSQFESLANLIRRDSITLTTASGSGHPTTCMSAADIMSWLFFREIKLDQNNLDHPDADKYIFSKGHAAPLLWALLYRLGYIEESELSTFRQVDSRLEGHPTARMPGIVAATGSLGQGLSVAVGMAEVYKREQRDQKIYVLFGDGEINEGQIWEAAMLAADRNLDNIVGIVDVNKIQQSNYNKEVLDMEPLTDKFASFGWNVVRINGNDLEDVAEAFEKAKANSGKPFMILADTQKGYGVSFLSGKLGKHGKALTAEEKEKAFAELPVAEGFNAADCIQSKHDLGAFEAPAVVKLDASVPADLDRSKKLAPRAAYGDALKALGAQSDRVWVLDGDVSNSTYSNHFAGAYPERHLECGIAEQNMVSAAVGVAAAGKVAVSNSFARFFERAYDQIEMGAYSEANFKVVGSHIGSSIGEDGASQMAMADCGFMRAIPGAVVLCPADYVSAYKLTGTLLETEGFVYMRNLREAVSVLYDNDETFELNDYKVPHQHPESQAVLLATGITVHESIQAAKTLAEDGIFVDVVDAYSLKPFPLEKFAQACEGKKAVFGVEDHYAIGGVGDIALEALNGSGVKVHKIAVEQFPESGKSADLLAKYGIDAAGIVKRVKAVLK